MLSDTAGTFLRWSSAMQKDVAARLPVRESGSEPDDDGDDLVRSCCNTIGKVVVVFKTLNRLVSDESELSQALSDLVHKNLACFRNLIQVQQILCNTLVFSLLRQQSFPSVSSTSVSGMIQQSSSSFDSQPSELHIVHVTVEDCAQYLARRLLKIRARLDDTCDVIARVAANDDARHSTRLQILFLELEEKIRLIAMDGGECEQKLDETRTRVKLACDQIYLWTPKVITLEMFAGIVSFSISVALQKCWFFSPKISVLAGVFTFLAASVFVFYTETQPKAFKRRFEDHLKIKDYRRFSI